MRHVSHWAFHQGKALLLVVQLPVREVEYNLICMHRNLARELLVPLYPNLQIISCDESWTPFNIEVNVPIRNYVNELLVLSDHPKCFGLKMDRQILSGSKYGWSQVGSEQWDLLVVSSQGLQLPMYKCVIKVLSGK